MDINHKKNFLNIQNKNNTFKNITKNPTYTQSQNVYIGQHKFLIIKTQHQFDRIHKYIHFCFDSILPLIKTYTKHRYDLDQQPYPIILQFLFAIADFNQLLNFIPHGKTQPIFLAQDKSQHKAKYKINTSHNILRAECMWIDSNDIIIFNEQLIKRLLKNSTRSQIFITVDKILEKSNLNLPSNITDATDIEVISEDILKKLSILFVIAEHFAIHLFTNNHDYIQHKKFNHKAQYDLTTVQSLIAITPTGNYNNLDKISSDLTSTNVLFKI